MCLLKNNDRSHVCNHEECKQLNIVNRQGCLFSLQHPKNSDMLANPFSLLQQSQLHDPKATVSPQQSNNNQQGFAKNTPKANHTIDRDDEPFTLNKKKLKVDGGFNASSESNTKSTTFSGYQPGINNNFADKMVFNKPLLNNILLGNNNEQKQQQNIQYVPIQQPMYMPMMQNGQQVGNMMGNQPIFFQYPQNGQIAMQQAQLPVQNFAQKANVQASGYFSPSKSNSNSNSSGENASNMEEMMRSMQEKLTEMLFSQNKMITDLREKNELVQDTLACLINEVCDLKQIVKKSTSAKGFETYDPKPMLLQPGMVDNSRETASTESLINFLYGGQKDFQYQLIFKNELPLPLYRERNFKFTVLLTDKDGNVVKNANRIPLTLAIYTSENPPKFIDVNTAGNKVLKGTIDKDLVDGMARFDKIQINEVTSHFRNGWVFFVVYPKSSGVALNNFVSGNGMAAINYQQVKPLVMEKIVVKAKRSKEREQNNEQESSDLKDYNGANESYDMRPYIEEQNSNIYIPTEN